MTRVSGGELLARSLANEGIRHVFSLPSPELDPILAALDDHGIRQVTFHDEIAGAHMAEGLYRETGQVGVVMGNPGPGAGSLFTGALTALSEGIPMVLVSAQAYPAVSYPSGPEVYQGNDQGATFRPFVKHSAPVLVWERIPEIVRQGFRAPTNERDLRVQDQDAHRSILVFRRRDRASPGGIGRSPRCMALSACWRSRHNPGNRQSPPAIPR